MILKIKDKVITRSKVKNKIEYTYHLMFKSDDLEEVREVQNFVYAVLRKSKDPRHETDVAPKVL